MADYFYMQIMPFLPMLTKLGDKWISAIRRTHNAKPVKLIYTFPRQYNASCLKQSFDTSIKCII